LQNGRIDDKKLEITSNKETKNILVDLGALHKQKEGTILIDKYSQALIKCCGLEIKDNKIIETNRTSMLSKIDEKTNAVELVSQRYGGG